MKKIAILLSLVLCTTITGCGKIKISFDKEETSSSVESSDTSSKKEENTGDEKEEASSKEDSKEENSTSSTSTSNSSDLGNDILSGKFKLDGVEYSIGVSIKDLEKNGWALETGKGKKVQANGLLIGPTIKKGNYVVSVTLKNASATEKNAEECIVSTIEAQSIKKIPFELPGGVSLDQNQSQVDSALKNVKVEKSDTSGAEFYYIKKGTDYTISIMIDKKTKQITSIKLKQ